MITASGGGAARPSGVTGDDPDTPGFFNPLFDDPVDFALRRIEAIREYMPVVYLIKMGGKVFVRIARDLALPIASDPDVGFPYLTINEARRLEETIRFLNDRARHAGANGGVVVAWSYFGADP